MLNGDEFKRPDITSTSVKKAFQTLTYTMQDDSDGITLKTLSLVDNFLDSPHCPPAENLRQYALAEILTDIVIQQLTRMRRLFDLPAPDIRDPLSVAHNQIIADSASDSPQLIGWSFIYHHYIRNELGITQERYSEISHMVKRTLRRYIQHTLEAVANILIEKEWSIRQKKHQQNLRQTIPVAQRIPITGRDKELYTLGSLLPDSDGAGKCILITGTAGCGKTTFVGQCLHQFITENPPDYLFWLNFFESVEDTYQRLLKATHLQQKNQLMKLFMSNRVVVIVDNLNNSNTRQIQRLVHLVRYTTCVLISRESVSLPDTTHKIHLSPLSQEAVIDMATQILPAVRQSIIEKQVEHIYQSEDQPGDLNAVKVALLQSNDPRSSKIHRNTGNGSFQAAYDDLSDAAKQIWWLLSRIDSKKSLKRYVYHDTSSHMHTAMQELYNNSILVYRNDIPLLAVNMPVLVQSDHLSANEISRMLDTFRQRQMPSLMLIVLLVSRETITMPLVKETIIYCWQKRDTIPHSDFIWRKVFHALNYLVSDDARLLLIQAQYLLSTQDIQSAYRTLQSAIFTAGHHGEFRLQTEIQLTLVSFYRRTSQYTRAQDVLETVKKTLSRYDEPTLFRVYTMEKIQLIFETSCFIIDDTTELDISSYPDETLQILMAEYRLFEDETRHCRQLANSILQRDSFSPEEKMAIWTVTGRSYIRDGQIERGIDWLNAVVSILEQSPDKINTARAQANLAAALLLSGTDTSYHEAEMLLRQAEATQQVIEDTVGLNVTYHNLDILRDLRNNA